MVICNVFSFESFLFLNVKLYIFLPGVLKTSLPDSLSGVQLIAGNLSRHNLLKAVTL